MMAEFMLLILFVALIVSAAVLAFQKKASLRIGPVDISLKWNDDWFSSSGGSDSV
jgi:hypothetical protein